jgi:hypothetical protein
MQDGYTFVMDKRCARHSIFIRSMLGEAGGSAQQRTKRIDVGASASTSMSLAQANGSGSATPLNGVHALGTPPPEEDSTPTTTAGKASEYVNPFASGPVEEDGAVDGLIDDGVDTPFADGFAEARDNTVHLSNIRGVILEKVVEYLCHTAKYSKSKDTDIPNFEHRIPPELALELLMAADFLQED